MAFIVLHAPATAQPGDANTLQEALYHRLPSTQQARQINVARHARGSEPRAGDNQRIMYSSTGGTFAYRPGLYYAVADDVTTTALDACDLSAYTIRVTGGGDGSGAGPLVLVAMFDGCPGAGGREIPGTAEIVELPDDGVFDIRIDLSGIVLPIPPIVWIRVAFSSRDAGWVFGAPPEIGFSEDAYNDPLLGCRTFFGGYPSSPHASFYVVLEAAQDCPRQFTSYRASGPAPLVRPEGQGMIVADDIRLATSSCELASYEVGVVGPFIGFSVDFELLEDGPGAPIPFTKRTFTGGGHGEIEVARFSFPPGIFLPNTLWMSWRSNTPSAAVPVTGRAAVGESQDVYATFDTLDAGADWNFVSFDGNPSAVFHININCRGDAPTGACCGLDAASNEPGCVDDESLDDCNGRWTDLATCAEGPFNPPCAAAACCLPDGDCSMVGDLQCASEGGVWQPGQFCGTDHECLPVACYQSIDDCFLAHDQSGCRDTACCAVVCALDSWCCNENWDSLCVELAEAHCPCPPLAGDLTCADGTVDWIDPPSGIVDARQPHPVDDSLTRQGLRQFLVEAPLPNQPQCWRICDAVAVNEDNNEVTAIAHAPSATQLISLLRPLALGTSELQFASSSECTFTSARFTAFPGDSNGDYHVDISDTLHLIDACLLNDCAGGACAYQCDMDRSDSVTVADLTRHIDLLIGAGSYAPWLNAMIPPDHSCP